MPPARHARENDRANDAWILIRSHAPPNLEMSGVKPQKLRVEERQAMRNKYTTLWIWLLLCPLALDYKAGLDDGSHVMQVVMTLPALGAGAILWLIAPSFTRRSR